MAKQGIGIGTSANDGTGDPLRTAMDKTNDNFNEVYALFGDGSTLAISGDATVSAGALTIANDAVENAMVADDAIDSAQIADAAIDTVHIADNNVTFAKLENRYTAKVDITTYTGAVSVDWSAGTTFKMGSSLTGAIEFDFTNFKQGQIITFYNLTGSQTITFDSDAGTSETFNKVAAVDYDGSTTNMIQVECIDDSANAIFNYIVAPYTSDTTPS